MEPWRYIYERSRSEERRRNPPVPAHASPFGVAIGLGVILSGLMAVGSGHRASGPAPMAQTSDLLELYRDGVLHVLVVRPKDGKVRDLSDFTEAQALSLVHQPGSVHLRLRSTGGAEACDLTVSNAELRRLIVELRERDAEQRANAHVDLPRFERQCRDGKLFGLRLQPLDVSHFAAWIDQLGQPRSLIATAQATLESPPRDTRRA